MKKRYKLEIEIYGEKDAIDEIIKQLIFVNVEVRQFKTDFSPKNFFKMCEKLEKQFYSKKKNK